MHCDGLMEGASCSQSCSPISKKAMRMKDEDRLSGLPEPLLHHILSYMDMKEVVHTSHISKRWKSVWRSVRNLNFDEDMWRNERTYNLKRGKFKFFVDTVLLLRDGSDIESFNLAFNAAYNSDIIRINRWIAYALKRRVQLLDLGCTFLEWTDLICLSSRINTLKLGGGVLPSNQNGELVLDIPFVENLTMRLFLGKSSSVRNAEIDTRISCIDKTESTETVFTRCVTKILNGLANAESLTLSIHGIQCFSEFPMISDGVPITFENLKYLKLRHWRDWLYIHPVAKLIESCPCLEALVMERVKIKFEEEDEEQDDEEDEEEALSFECMFRHLKYIEIHDFEGTENELMFLAFLLKNALVLENINIISTTTSNEKEEDMVKFREKIQSVQMASSSVTVLLNSKKRL